MEQVAAAACGDVQAFQSLWHAHREPVFRFAFWMLGDTAAAEDVSQECFLALLQHPKRFDPTRGSLRTFILAIARNHCRIRWRDVQAEIGLEECEAILKVAPSVIADLSATDITAILNTAIANLPPLQREALYLIEFEGLSLIDAAVVAGTDVGTLKSRLHRSRQGLKRGLGWLVKEGF